MPNEPTVNLACREGGDRVAADAVAARHHKHYAAIAALTDVSFEVRPGEVHALLGENGAGKSTLMNVASGTTAPDAGTIIFEGAPVEQPHARDRAGPRDRDRPPASGAPPDMTVAENILVAVGREHLRRRDPDVKKAMRALLDDVHFLGHLEDRVSSLSVARRHLLELAKAFAVSPRLLILDEPTAPLSQDSVELLFAPSAARGGGNGRRLHHAPAGRGARDRRPRDGPARRQAAGHLRRSATISDADLLAMIIGRTLDATFPPKQAPAAGEAPSCGSRG